MGMSMMATSYAVQDFTSQLDTRGLAGAISAVQNNIPGMLMGFDTFQQRGRLQEYP